MSILAVFTECNAPMSSILMTRSWPCVQILDNITAATVNDLMIFMIFFCVGVEFVSLINGFVYIESGDLSRSVLLELYISELHPLDSLV